MSQSANPAKMACLGAPTVPIFQATCDMEECQACEKRVAWDLVDSKLFGFQNCSLGKDIEAKRKEESCSTKTSETT